MGRLKQNSEALFPVSVLPIIIVSAAFAQNWKWSYTPYTPVGMIKDLSLKERGKHTLKFSPSTEYFWTIFSCGPNPLDFDTFLTTFWFISGELLNCVCVCVVDQNSLFFFFRQIASDRIIFLAAS